MSPQKDDFQPEDADQKAGGVQDTSGKAGDQERQYTLSISNEDRQKSFEMEDERWSRNEQIKDWLKLGLLVLITLTWQFIVYFLEPGLR